MVKIGDKVRFLSEKGGGKVAGFQGKGIVLVEDEDGFQVPTPVNEVVVVDSDNYDMKPPTAPKAAPKPAATQPKPAPKPAPLPAEERKGGNALSAYIAFVPVDIKEVSKTRFELYFVNDSNYHIHYTLSTAEGAAWVLHYAEEVEPNTKCFIEEIGREDLEKYGRISIQATAYKKGRPYAAKRPADIAIRVDLVKFYKLHTFRENDFFEQPALLYTIVENDKAAQSISIDPATMKEEMYATAKAAQGKAQQTPERNAAGGKGGDVVVDLHASELLETTAGMGNSDILAHQLKVFNDTLAAHAKEKGRKIVFIHGKGEGVLRQAILGELKRKYKSYSWQDASFREYGYGATQVTIR